MQGILLVLIAVLAVVLYKLLSGQKLTYTYIRTTKKELNWNDNSEFFTSEQENGFLTIDKAMLIVEEEEYALKSENDLPPEAFLNIQQGRLISVRVKLLDGEKTYFIDPENNSIKLSIPQTSFASTTFQTLAI